MGGGGGRTHDEFEGENRGEKASGALKSEPRLDAKQFP